MRNYASPSPAARAALQLQAIGKEMQPGERVRFLYVYGVPNVWAWDRPEAIDPRQIDVKIYRKLMLRSAADVFQPFGINQEALVLLLENNATALPLLPARSEKKIFCLK